MANQTGTNPLVLDTIGELTASEVIVKKVVIIPNTAGNGCRFDVLNRGATPKDSVSAGTATVTLTTTIVSTGNFTTGKCAVGDYIVIRNTSTGNNIGAHRITARTDNDTIVCAGAVLTNEVAGVYTWDIITPQKAIQILTQATTKKDAERDFGEGQAFRNLILGVISEATDVVYVYLK